MYFFVLEIDTNECYVSTCVLCVQLALIFMQLQENFSFLYERVIFYVNITFTFSQSVLVSGLGNDLYESLLLPFEITHNILCI
jgi:hypothetical protein